MEHPLLTAYNRLDEAHRAWHQALDGYHNIEDFRAGINTAIQALRNVTFVLQSQKSNLINFEPWYEKWQEQMKADPILKELHQARNVIVKQQDLILHSTAIARIKGWIDFHKTAFTFNPMKDSYNVANGFYETYARHIPFKEVEKERVIFEFERRWIYDKLPETELLDAIAHTYSFLNDLIKDAEEEFSIKSFTRKSAEYCQYELNNGGQLQCMILTPQDRSLFFSFRDGKPIKMKSIKLNKGLEDIEKAHNRYGDEYKSQHVLDLLKDIFPEEYPFNQIQTFAQAAISVLKKDKYLVPISFIFTEENISPLFVAHEFQNQETKIISIDKLAGLILKNNGKFVFMISEIWRYTIGDIEDIKYPSEENTLNAKDAAQFCFLSAKELRVVTIPFRKNFFGKITFSKPEVENFSTDTHDYFILRPVITALKKVHNK